MKQTIVDLGCGTGNTLKPYAKKYQIIGVDENAENIATCQNELSNGTWIQGDITQFDLNKYANLKKIICTEVLEHVANWQAVIKNFSNVPSQTEVWLTVPYEQSEKKLLAKRKNYWQEIGHLNFFNGEEIKKELIKNNWQNIRLKRVNAALYFELQSLFRLNAPCVRHTYYENILPLPIKLFYQLFRPNLFQTKLKYIPFWIITLPVAIVLNKFWGATIEITAEKR